MGETLRIPETKPETLAELLRDPAILEMLARHTIEMDEAGLLDTYKTEIANTRFLDNTPDFMRQDDHFADFIIKKYMARSASLKVDAPILVSRETKPADLGLGIQESTTWGLIKVSPVTGLVYPDSQLDVCEESFEFGTENPLRLSEPTIDLVKRHYQEQVDAGIVLKGQYPEEAGIF